MRPCGVCGGSCASFSASCMAVCAPRSTSWQGEPHKGLRQQCVNRPLEPHCQVRQLYQLGPTLGIKFRMWIEVEPDVLVLTEELQREPTLPLAAITSAERNTDQLRRQIVGQPAGILTDDAGATGAD